MGLHLKYTHNEIYLFMLWSFSIIRLESRCWDYNILWGMQTKAPCFQTLFCISLSLFLIWCRCNWNLWVGLDSIRSSTDQLLHHDFWHHYRRMMSILFLHSGTQSDLAILFNRKDPGFHPSSNRVEDTLSSSKVVLFEIIYGCLWWIHVCGPG